MVPGRMGLQDGKGPSGISVLSEWTFLVGGFHRDPTSHSLKIVIIIHYYEGKEETTLIFINGSLATCYCHR